MRILVVEDEAMIAMLLADWLDELGHTVVGPVATVKAALAALGEGGVEAALLDLNLEDGDSSAVAARLRAADLPFAFASGTGAGGLAEPFRGCPTLSKPFEFEELEALVGGWQDRGAGAKSA